MERFLQLFKRSSCNIIGMVHLRALPGTPKSALTVKEVSEIACREAEIYARRGLDGIIIENMHDTPYIRASSLGPEIIATMCRISYDIKSSIPDIPCGIQVLAAGNKEALAIAQSAGLDFIRCEGFVFGHVADEGYIESCAGTLLRYRKSIGAEHIQIYCDVKKKHSAHAITSDVSLAETARAAEFFMADGVIVTGNATGDPANPSELQGSPEFPVLEVLETSLKCHFVDNDFSAANGIIVGSYFKQNGRHADSNELQRQTLRWDREIDEERVQRLMEVASTLRSKPK